jgi:hypothetical protein
MSKYDVAWTELDAIPGVHGGTGRQQSTNWVVVPGSVPSPGNLRFEVADADVTTLLYAIGEPVVPNWFGVAVPHGLADFTRAHVFFHPLPAQAGYVDAQYATKAGQWPQLFYYMERLGNQLDEARRGQVIVMPFLTEAAQDTGVFAPNWRDIVTDILSDVRGRMGAGDGSTLELQQLVVSSYSVGIVYSHAFRLLAPGLAGVLAEVWDFDGAFSSEAQYSNQLTSTAEYRAIKYDQRYATDASAYHVPLPRWVNYVQPPRSGGDVHAYIRDFMFLHASSVSEAGALIEDTAATGSGTAAGTGTASAAGTGTTAVAATGTTAVAATGTVGTSIRPGGSTEVGTGSTPPATPPAAPASRPAPAPAPAQRHATPAPVVATVQPSVPSQPPVAGPASAPCTTHPCVASSALVATTAITALTAIAAAARRLGSG